MKYAILGDIHSNLDALNAVIHDANSHSIDQFACVGDVVGYGPEPSKCIERLKEIDAKVVAGNHDWAILERIDVEVFNPIARASALWTRAQLSTSEKSWLEQLPLTIDFDHFHLTHGTLHQPSEFFYMQSFYDAEKTFDEMNLPLCICGHSHVPVNFYRESEGTEIFYDQLKKLSINIEQKTIVNVGSVGQPRDGNPQTIYGLYDTENHLFELKRLSYDIDSVVKKILSSGLPEYNAERLRIGN